MPHVSRGFRVALKRELTAWTEEGLVSSDTAGHLAGRYGLGDLATESRNQTAAAIFTIGSLLVGGGVIAFVSAHWDRLGPWPKLALLLAFLLALHGAGAHLWLRRGWPRLGHAAVFCACLVFGASIALLAQTFHIDEDWYLAFGAWGLGSIAVAWALRSSLIGALGVVVSFFWFVGRREVDPHVFALWPYLVGALALPLAYVNRSAPLFALIVVALAVGGTVLGGTDGDAAWAAMAGGLAGALLTWGLGFLHRGSGDREEFGFAATLGAAMIGLVAYLVSFRDFAREMARDAGPEGYAWLVPAAAMAVAGAVAIGMRWGRRPPRGADRMVAFGVIGAVALAAAAISTAARGEMVGSEWSASVLTSALLGNLAAVTLAVVGISSGVRLERRGAFWLGALFAVLLVLSRFFEYQTSLLQKSAAFFACGIAVIWAGVAFERRLRGGAGGGEQAGPGEDA